MLPAGYLAIKMKMQQHKKEIQFKRPSYVKTIYTSAYISYPDIYCAAIIFAGSRTFTLKYVFSADKHKYNEQMHKLYAEAQTAEYAKKFLQDKGYDSGKFNLFMHSLILSYKGKIPYRDMLLEAAELAMNMKEKEEDR